MNYRLGLLFMSLFPLLLVGQEQNHSAYYYQRVSLFESLPASGEDIIFLGNSITDGGEWVELFPGKPVKNRGISGDTADGVYDRLESIIKGKPAKIFLLIGINDLARGKSPNSIVNRIALITERIQKEVPQTKLYIQSVLPVNDCFGLFKGHTSRWDEVKKINEGLRQLAENTSTTYVDLYSCFIGEEPDKMDRTYSNDGLHLMSEGYFKWAELITPYVEE